MYPIIITIFNSLTSNILIPFSPTVEMEIYVVTMEGEGKVMEAFLLIYLTYF